ncbi:MAG: hypothetical protein ACFFC6_09585 [Promethearchaeota archaeon]
MKISSQKLKNLFFCVIALSFVCIWSSPFFSSSAIVKTVDQRNKVHISSDQVLINGVPENALFTNDSSSHNYLIQDIIQGQAVYFSLDPSTDYNVTLYNPMGAIFKIERTIHATKYLGSWKASVSGTWKLQVNYTKIVGDESLSYKILASIPTTGYNEISARQVNESFAGANYTLDHEVHFWKVFLNKNQNGTIFLEESEPSVLYHAEIQIYRQGYPQNPVLPPTQIETTSYNFSWNAYSSDTYFIVLAHNPEAYSPTGKYNISFVAEQYLYDFDTAGRLPHNQTISIRVNQAFSPRKPFYFWFLVNSSEVNVFIRVYGPNSSDANILEDCTVEIKDEGRQRRVGELYEENTQDVDKQFNISLMLSNAGKYYLIVSPESNAVGMFYIHFEYYLPEIPGPFVWTPLAIILNLIILLALPGYLTYLDWKGKWYQINQWSVPTSLQKTYKILKNSFSGFFEIKEVPDTSILIPITNIPFKTYGMLNFIESSQEETLVIAKRLRRKVEWLLYFLIGIIIYDILNFLLFTFFSITILPIDISNSLELGTVLTLPTILLIIIVSFVNVFAYLGYSQVINRISYTIENYQESSSKEFTTKSLDPEQAQKNINYVRVLWNQAKHAFKENNYELFVIKADAAVKNLLSTRFQQLITDPIYSKPDFQFQVANLRNCGFDLPSDKKIVHFRNLRNRIVHSSITLNEKESVDCFAFYSTFIARLGLRSS